MTIYEILLNYLRNNNFDGLTDTKDCCCKIEDLATWCYGKECLNCKPGHIIYTSPKEDDWDIVID